MSNRLEGLRARMAERELPAVLIMKDENRAYLSGFTGSSGALIITPRDAVLLTDGRYTEQAKAEAPEFRVVRHGAPMAAAAKQVAEEAGITRIAFEKDFLTVAQYEQWSALLAPLEMTGMEELTESLRLYKDAGEVQLMQKAQDITDAAFEHVLQFIKAGVTESEVALELEYTMKKLGADGLAFETIVASGERGALPHGRASDKVIASGDLVTMDFGASYRGYASDMTRTVMVGDPSEKQREIYELVLEAQRAGVAAVKPGLTGKEVDEVTRSIIAAKGYGDAFSHGTGHGVGLAVHEAPAVSARSEETLRPGMVVTVEPGIYLPGFGGVRIEDMVLVTETGGRVFGRSSKDLIIL